MLKRLIAVRHGETVDNARGVAQGWSDSELSEEGIEQAHKLAQRLRDEDTTSIFCSTLPRARKTAEIIAAETKLEVTELDDLRELNVGEWEGIEFEHVRQSEPERFRAWISDPEVSCPGGESFSQLDGRMKRALDRIERDETNDGSDAIPLVVSHGLAIRILASRLLGFPLGVAFNLLQDNAAINVFERRSNRYLLRSWNDTSHYRSSLS